jgi:hypothetical protein
VKVKYSNNMYIQTLEDRKENEDNIKIDFKYDRKAWTRYTWLRTADVTCKHGNGTSISIILDELLD